MTWESIIATPNEAVDRLPIPSGWLYRTIWHRPSAGLGVPEQSGHDVVFVPRSIFDLDHPYQAPEDRVSEPVMVEEMVRRHHPRLVAIAEGRPIDA